MRKQHNIDQQVDKTLQALDDMSRAKTDAFFYSRLQAKLEHRGKAGISKEYGFTFSVAAVILMILINLSSMVFYDDIFTPSDEETLSDYTTELAPDYYVFDISYYSNLEED